MSTKTVKFEQEKFDALKGEIETLSNELMRTDCYFKFLELSAIRAELVAQIESCVCVVNGATYTIADLGNREMLAA